MSHSLSFSLSSSAAAMPPSKRFPHPSSTHHVVHELFQIHLPAVVFIKEAENVAQLLVSKPVKPRRHQQSVELRDVELTVLVTVNCAESSNELLARVLCALAC